MVAEELELQDLIPRRYANPFMASGIRTVGDVIDLIHAMGLSRLRTGAYIFGCFGHEAKFVRGAGPAAWAALLAAIEQQGVEWQHYVRAASKPGSVV
jgi:hypothetical protein